MQPIETVIKGVYESQHGEISIRFKFKFGELTDEQIKNAREMWRDGIPQEIAWKTFQEEEGMAGEHTYVVPEKKGETLYQHFKRICIDYSGMEYYLNLKKHLGIEHLSDLEKDHSISMIEDLFRCQEWWIENKTHPFGTIFDHNSLIHKDNAYKKWEQLFQSFNS